MLRLTNIVSNDVTDTVIVPTYNVKTNKTFTPFLNMIGNLNTTNVINKPTVVVGKIINGIITSGTVTTFVDCSISLVDAVISYGIIQPDTTITNARIVTNCGKVFTSLTIENAVIINATIIEVTI